GPNIDRRTRALRPRVVLARRRRSNPDRTCRRRYWRAHQPRSFTGRAPPASPRRPRKLDLELAVSVGDEAHAAIAVPARRNDELVLAPVALEHERRARRPAVARTHVMFIDSHWSSPAQARARGPSKTRTSPGEKR